MHFLPVFLIGAAVLFTSKRKRRKPASKALPARGEIFQGEGAQRPDVIAERVGDRFSISFPTRHLDKSRWILKASPPDNSILHVRTDYDAIVPQTPRGPDGIDIFVFDAVKPGKGSLVFHWQDPLLDGTTAPVNVAEFLTEVS